MQYIKICAKICKKVSVLFTSLKRNKSSLKVIYSLEGLHDEISVTVERSGGGGGGTPVKMGAGGDCLLINSSCSLDLC